MEHPVFAHFRLKREALSICCPTSENKPAATHPTDESMGFSDAFGQHVHDQVDEHILVFRIRFRHQ